MKKQGRWTLIWMSYWENLENITNDKNQITVKMCWDKINNYII